MRNTFENVEFGVLKTDPEALIIAIDFDGTIIDSKWGEPFHLRPGAKEFINRMYCKHNIIIWTCRADRDLIDAVHFLYESGINFNLVNTPVPTGFYSKEDQPIKIYADVYIDDRGWPYDMKDFKLEIFEDKINELSKKKKARLEKVSSPKK